MGVYEFMVSRTNTIVDLYGISSVINVANRFICVPFVTDYGSGYRLGNIVSNMLVGS